jgi:hypothetical protein
MRQRANFCEATSKYFLNKITPYNEQGDHQSQGKYAVRRKSRHQ